MVNYLRLKPFLNYKTDVIMKLNHKHIVSFDVERVFLLNRKQLVGVPLTFSSNQVLFLLAVTYRQKLLQYQYPVPSHLLTSYKFARGHIEHNIPGFHLIRSEEHTSELQSRGHLVCRLLLEKKKNSIRNQSN